MGVTPNNLASSMISKAYLCWEIKILFLKEDTSITKKIFQITKIFKKELTM